MSTNTHMHSSPLVRRMAFLALLLAMLLAGSGGIARAADCPNQQAREQNNSTPLSDCRAYEMVSPLDKNGGDISTPHEIFFGSVGVIQTTPDAAKITYHALAAFGADAKGLPIQSQYLSTRTADGWTTQNITTPQSTPPSLNTTLIPYAAFNTNLTEGLVLNNNTQHREIEDPAIGGAPPGYRDYFFHNINTGINRALLTTTPPETPEAFNRVDNMNLEGYAATPDLQHAIFNSESQLLSTVTAGGRNLYESTNGQIEPINILPGVTNGETATSGKLGSEEGYQSHTISDDGSRVFWSIGRGANALYVREGVGTPQARTLQVDAGIGGTGVFLTASTSGDKVFFTKGNQGTGSLDEYDLEKEELIDLTPSIEPGGPRVQGVLGASDDGSYVYFVARGALAPGATSQNCENHNIATGCNLYLWHAGSPITFIAELTGGDNEGGPGADDWAEAYPLRTARVSPDGRNVLFMSGARLTPYDNAGVQEVYEYQVGTAGPVCASCNPSGARPVGASSIPGATVYGFNSAIYAARALAGDGSRVFFDSNDELSSADTNHQKDVYEWERSGSGTCEEVAGCITLVSTGTGSEPTTFVDASENGSDVFMTTRQELTPGDTDQQVDLYDARENGGYVIANPPACTGTGCQGVPSAPPIFATPPTLTFEGTGNLAPPKVVVKHKALTRAQRLSRALRACHAKPRKQRSACQRRARSRYGPVHKKTKR